jgi:hypothetical protein
VEVGGVEVTEADLAWLQERGRSADRPSRSKLARAFCDRKGLVDCHGNRREVSARVILGRLNRSGKLSLPRQRGKIPGSKPHSTTSLEELYRGDAKTVRGLRTVELVPVTSRDRVENAQWRCLMEEKHYLGAGPLCGAQIRYLVRCREGLLGALSFSASAWRLAVRDRYIEWSERARRQNLQLVVSNSRFLLVPKIPNLASHVLSLAVSRLASDWEERYGYRPVLVESFVDANRFKGSSYRAANWIHVGSTSGRGRQDREHEEALGKKEVFLYPLEEFWREKLCVEPVRELEADEEDWTVTEFAEADFEDERLTKRLIGIAKDFFARPTLSIPAACASRARTKAVYRFCSHENVDMQGILEPHYESTLSRVAKEKTVLAIQDTTSVNYSAHLATEGLGPIGTSQGQLSVGLYVHSTLALNLAGTPLGLLNVESWARDPEEYGKSAERAALPIEDKESRKWLVGYVATVNAQRRLQNTRIVNVCDREADIFDLFVFARREEGNPDLLVRATQPRKLESGDPKGKGKATGLWDFVRSLPCEGTLPLRVPRRGSRPSRLTTLSVRFSQVSVRPPKGSPHKASVRLWAIAVTEEEPPAGIEPVEWLLLTTIPVTSLEEAAEKVQWYTLRWQIEVYHKTLKSGCRIEDRQLGTAQSLEACLAVDMVVAWRIFHLAKLGRETPDAPCTVYFDDAHWKALVCFLKKSPKEPTVPPTLRQAMHMVATLGGFQGRKSDGNPGTETLWKGLQRLDDITATVEVFAPWGKARLDTS